MANTDGKQGPGADQGNAIENETREADSRQAGSVDGESIEAVTEEESKLAEEHPDGGESGGKKY